MQQLREAELMDEPTLEAERHFDALRGLARVNRISRSAAVLAGPIAQLANRLGRPPRVLDVASGGGDVAGGLAARGFQVMGIDVSDRAVEYAKQRNPAADFSQCDVLKEDLPTGYDVVTCSLFLHHLDRNDAVHAIMKMAAVAGALLLIDDLNRNHLAYATTWVGTRVLSRSDVVHVDGPRSVRAAWTPGEAMQLAAEAGLEKVTVRRRFPFRWVMTWHR